MSISMVLLLGMIMCSDTVSLGAGSRPPVLPAEVSNAALNSIAAGKDAKHKIPPPHGHARSCTPNVCDPNISWTPEGEPTCTDGYVDTYNGGCDSDPTAFSTLNCGDSVCGESGNYLLNVNQYRDTDWYEITVTTDTRLTIVFRADFDAVIGFVEMDRGEAGCADCNDRSGFIAPAWTPLACEETVVEVCVPGQVACDPNNPTTLQNAKYWIYVSTDGYEGVACGSKYELSLACDTCNVPGCPTGNTLDGQRPNSNVEISSASVFVSDSQFFHDYDYNISNGIKRFESFSGISAEVADLHWWGLAAIYNDDHVLVRCPDPNSGVPHGSNCTHFEIQFWPFDDYTNRPDLSGGPLHPPHAFRVTAAPVETELDYWSYLGPVLYWNTVLPYSWFDVGHLKGWISIQHIGEADAGEGWAAEPCQFWWHTSPEGDTIHVSLDARTGVTEDGDGDLAYCLTGTPTTFTGACCRATEDPPTCYDDVDVADCMAWGDFFNPNELCAHWPDEYCEDLPTAACCINGTWPCIDDYTFWYCRLVEFGTWHAGESCFDPNFICPITVSVVSDECPEDANWKQNCDHSGYNYPSHNAGMPASGGPRAIDNYDLSPNPVLRIGWYGMDVVSSTEDCDFPNPADFIIRFYDGPIPAGPPDLSSYIEYSVSAFVGETIWAIGALGKLKYWETYLSTPGPTDGWWSVQSDNITMNDDECLFWWFEGDQTDDGDGHVWFWDGNDLEQIGDGGANPHDTAWCMWSDDTLGWCCHCEDGQCHNEWGSACVSAGRLFTEDQGDCLAACEPALGACCNRVSGACAETFQANCDPNQNEEWLGCDTTCVSCCVPPCDPNATPEGEPTCGDDYVDSYNGGCNSDPVTYQLWDMSAKVRGETGLYQSGGQTDRDTDWYKVPISITQVEGFTWHVRGEFYQQTIIMTDCIGVGMRRGDCNGDGSINALDIDQFVGALTDPNSVFPLKWECVADCNCDGWLNSLDIDPFVQCLTGVCPSCDCDQPYFEFEPSHNGDYGKCYPAYPALAIVKPGDASYLLFYVSAYTDDNPEPECGTVYSGTIELTSAGSCTIGGVVCSLRTEDVCSALGGVFVAGASCP